jgi:hypothetical protein
MIGKTQQAQELPRFELLSPPDTILEVLKGVRTTSNVLVLSLQGTDLLNFYFRTNLFETLQ